MPTAASQKREPYELVTLDGFALRRRAGSAASDSGVGEKPCILLAFLALVRVSVPRQVLCDLLWEGAPKHKARNSLRQALFRIRRALGESSIVETNDGVTLAPGLLSVDVRDRLDYADPDEDTASLGRELAERFGRTAKPVGTAFDDWRARVRRQLERGVQGATNALAGELRLMSSSAPTRRGGSAPERQSGPRAPGAPAMERLVQLWRLSTHGIPTIVWAAGRPETALRARLADFTSRCQANGASVAVVPRRLGPGYPRFTLERELAEVLWPLPGGAGITPEHREVLENLVRGNVSDHALLRSATLDLMSAVAENAPLVIVLSDPARYAIGTLTALVADLGGMRNCPILLVVADHAGVRPVSASCIEVGLV